MISANRTETETRYFAECYGEKSERTTTETRYAFSGTGHFSLTASCIEFCDPYGERDRQMLSVWLDGGEISDAVVDWLASLQNAATNENNPRLQAGAIEKLQRFAGAMGLTYATPSEIAA